jgi:sialic acid synthase SpsE
LCGRRKAIGVETYEITPKQKAGKQFSCRLYVAEDIKRGDIVRNSIYAQSDRGMASPQNITIRFLGKTVNRNLSRGEAFRLSF